MALNSDGTLWKGIPRREIWEGNCREAMGATRVMQLETIAPLQLYLGGKGSLGRFTSGNNGRIVGGVMQHGLKEAL